LFFLQHKLKSSQKDKVRQFVAFTQTGEKTAIQCLGSHEWKLDVAVENYFQFPERYNREPKMSVDRRKIEQLFLRYKGQLEFYLAQAFQLRMVAFDTHDCMTKRDQFFALHLPLMMLAMFLK